MDEKKAYYGIITEIWKSFRNDLETVAGITDPEDARWTEIVERYEAIERNAPQGLKRYAGEMVLMHVRELEDKWRFRNL